MKTYLHDTFRIRTRARGQDQACNIHAMYEYEYSLPRSFFETARKSQTTNNPHIHHNRTKKNVSGVARVAGIFIYDVSTGFHGVSRRVYLIQGGTLASRSRDACGASGKPLSSKQSTTSAAQRTTAAAAASSYLIRTRRYLAKQQPQLIAVLDNKGRGCCELIGGLGPDLNFICSYR